MGMVSKLRDPVFVLGEATIELVVTDKCLVFESGDVGGKGVDNTFKCIEAALYSVETLVEAIFEVTESLV